MQLILCPIPEILKDIFFLEFEFLFLKEVLVLAKFLRINIAIVEPINILVKLTKRSILIKDIKTLLAEINKRLSNISIRSQKVIIIVRQSFLVLLKL